MPGRAITMALGLTLSILAGLPCHAQTEPQSRSDTGPRKIDITLERIPLRSAIDLVGSASGLQYAINPNVPDVLITLKAREVTPLQALRLIVREASRQVPGLSVSKRRL